MNKSLSDVLYKKYEPKSFSEIIGHKSIINLLQNILKKKLNIHGIIFTGFYGTGKTLLAKLFAIAINCEQKNICKKCVSCKKLVGIFDTNVINDIYDITIIDGASNNGVDNIRELIQNSINQSLYFNYRIIIIDEAHMLSKSAMEALLIQLQSPPKHVIFLFTTTEIHKITDTLRSRCLEINIPQITKKELKNYLNKILQMENISLVSEQINMIIDVSNGSVRGMLSALQKIILFDVGNDITKTEQALNVVSVSKIYKIFLLIMQGDIDTLLDYWNDLYKNGVSKKYLLLQLTKIICEFMQLIRGKKANINEEFLQENENIKDSLSMSLLFQFSDIILETLQSLNNPNIMKIFFFKMTHVENIDYLSFKITNMLKLSNILENN